jgi:uncharacterized protein
MSSTERAPEPTMEEILASIRRIISEDEASEADQRTAAPSPDVEDLGNGEDKVDNQTIDDIARALSGAPAPAEEPAEEEEDILDLTAELGGLELVEELVHAEAAPSEPLPSPTIEPAPGPDIEVVSTPEIQTAASPEMKAAAPLATPELAPAPPLSASDEAASALERAIAALRAGQVPTSLTDLMSQPPSPPEPQFQTQPEPEPEPVSPIEPEAAPEPETSFESEPEFVLTEFEETVVTEETFVVEALDSESEEAASADQPSLWMAQPAEPKPEPEPAGRSNGWGTHRAYDAAPVNEGASKTVEDIVKDMLRPMLRQWLDENMSRVLTAALEDELKNDPARFQRD